MKLHLSAREETERSQNPQPVYVYDVHNRPNVMGGIINILPHWHGELEIMLPKCRGTANIDGESIDFGPNDILIVSPDMMHSCQCSEKGMLFAITVNLSYFDFKKPDKAQVFYIQPVLSGKVKFPSVIWPGNPSYTSLLKYTEDLIASAAGESPIGVKARAFMLLADLLGKLSQPAENEDIRNGILPTLKKSLIYIESKYLTKITVDEIASDAGFSKYCYIRNFKKIFQKTPMEYIIELRLFNSLDLIMNGASVTDAALDSGFFNLSYFIRKFKERFGTTPSKVKKTENFKV